jgi:hypothetical protein
MGQAGPKPLAIGLIRYPRAAASSVRRRARQALMARAEVEGFAVTEVFEVDGTRTKDVDVLAALEALALRVGAQAVLTVGAISLAGLAVTARRAELAVIAVLQG